MAIDPKHNILLFENDQVRVFRSWREPGAEERSMNTPAPGGWLFFLTDIDAIGALGGVGTPLHAIGGRSELERTGQALAPNTGTRNSK